MKENKFPIYETMAIAVGEIICSAIVCGVFLILKKFALSVLLGAVLGSVVTVLNFVFLVISTNRAIDNALAERGEGEMTDEEAAEFAAKHQGKIQAAARISYIARTASVALCLVLAFLLDGVFNVISTAIPLLLFRPILTVSQLIKKKIIKNNY